MSSNINNYAVDNQNIVNQYWDTDNPVTRNTLLNILRRRGDAGDDEARVAGVAIEIANVNSNIEQTKTDSIFNDAELLFIASHALTPGSVDNYYEGENLDCGDGILFKLGDIEYHLDYNDMLLINDDYEPISPEFMVKIIKERDPSHELTLMLLDAVLEPILNRSIYIATEFVRDWMSLIDYIEQNLKDERLPMHDCNVQYVKDTLMWIDEYGIHDIKSKMSKSITPRDFTYSNCDYSTLNIKRTLFGGVNISDMKLPGVTLSADNYRDKTCKDQYTLIIKDGATDDKESAWMLDDEDNESMWIAGNVICLCIAINNSLHAGLDLIEQISERKHIDIFIYDRTSAESLLALAIAVTPNSINKNFNYSVVDIADTEKVINDINGKSICFVGVKPVNNDWLDYISDCRVVNLNGQDESSCVFEAWRYATAKPAPFIIKLFKNDCDDYLKTNLTNGILNNTDDNPFKVVGPIVSEIINNTKSTDTYNVFPGSAKVLLRESLDSTEIFDFRIK